MFREIVSKHHLDSAPRKPCPSRMIFISAGFDALTTRMAWLLGLVEADYMWVNTEQLKAVAAEFSNRRIVSLLEGGYSRRPPVARGFAQYQDPADL